MRHIQQHKPFDCGVAVAAMVADVPYESVLDRLVTGLSSESAFSNLVMWRVLQDLTNAEWSIVELRISHPRVGEHAFGELPIAVLIERGDLSRHYIAVHGEVIYDPLFESPVKQQSYADRESKVVAVFSAKM